MTITIKNETQVVQGTKNPVVGKAYRGCETGSIYICVSDRASTIGGKAMTNLGSFTSCSVVGEYVEVDLEITVK